MIRAGTRRWCRDGVRGLVMMMVLLVLVLVLSIMSLLQLRLRLRLWLWRQVVLELVALAVVREHMSAEARTVVQRLQHRVAVARVAVVLEPKEPLAFRPLFSELLLEPRSRSAHASRRRTESKQSVVAISEGEGEGEMRETRAMRTNERMNRSFSQANGALSIDSCLAC